jgi:monoamine oxidase
VRYDCIVIGAGVSGLMAANELVSSGKKVLILEAQDRPGGRIHTTHLPGFDQHVELGAEFLHGEVVLTKALLDKAGIPYRPMQGKVYQVQQGEPAKGNLFDRDWKRIMKSLNKLEHDIPFKAFLNANFPGPKQKTLHETITKFVEGYSAADVNKVSSFALRDEWSEENEPVQNRPVGGYTKLIEYLLNEGTKKGLEVKYTNVVKHITWQKGVVEVTTVEDHRFDANKVLLTVPLGILQTERIRISPAIREHAEASKKIGFGSVVKFHCSFKASFWREHVLKKFRSPSFIFSDASIPTWWSQLPEEIPMLTGWLGGPSVDRLVPSERDLTDRAVNSLAYLFQCTVDVLRNQVIDLHVKNWKNDPFTLGAYSYNTIETIEALQVLQTSIEHTLYFAGEALYLGPHTGTVEAALISGRSAAQKLLAEAL